MLSKKIILFVFVLLLTPLVVSPEGGTIEKVTDIITPYSKEINNGVISL